jgi:hypothetical protein
MPSQSMQSSPAGFPVFGASPPAQVDSQGFGGATGGGFGAQPAQQPNAFGASDAFAPAPQQGFGQHALASQSGTTPAYSQQQALQQHAAHAAAEDAKQRRAVIIAGAFAVIGVAALVLVLVSGR